MESQLQAGGSICCSVLKAWPYIEAPGFIPLGSEIQIVLTPKLGDPQALSRQKAEADWVKKRHEWHEDRAESFSFRLIS